MRLGVASLAFLPGTGLIEQAQTIRRLGATRLDARIAAEDGLVPTMTVADAIHWQRRLADLGVSLGCLYAYPDADAAQLAHLRRLAPHLGADMIRVLVGRREPAQCTTLLAEALVDGEDGPLLVLQNHARSSLDLVNALTVVRDLDHPRLRLACSPDHEHMHDRWSADLLSAVAPWTGLWMWCDVGHDGTAWRQCLPGHGSVPWPDIAPAITGTDPAFTCKWERRWHPELPAIDVALPAFRQQIAATLGGRYSV